MIDKSRRKLLLAVSSLPLVAVMDANDFINNTNETEDKSGIQQLIGYMNTAWGKYEQRTPNEYLDYYQIDTLLSAAQLKDKISHEFSAGNTITVQGLILSKIETALVITSV